MKKNILYTALACLSLTFGSCSDYLDTYPTQNPSEEKIFENVESAKSVINGAYRNMYTVGWSEGWPHENCGLSAILLTADVMGEDHVMYNSGQGWFYYDYLLSTQMDYTHTSGHPYAFWNLLYTTIDNVNEILAHEKTLAGDENEVKDLMAQAYAMRAMCYHYLIQLYQQTYIGHENAPGVPVYTEPTSIHTQGKPRGTVAETYERINKDIDSAIVLFDYVQKATGNTNGHEDPSFVDYYVANGFKARICMTQNRYPEAEAAAEEALKAPYARLASVSEFAGMNNAENANVLWGMKMQVDQEASYGTFMSHMDADATGMYAQTAQKCISANLYNKLSDTDERKANWFRGPLEEEGQNSNVSYCQLKFKMKDMNNLTADVIFMRVEEMILIKAEAQCMQDNFTGARETLKTLMENRDPQGYAAVLASVTDSKNYQSDTNAPIVTLMDEILLQRRIELWGETGRLFDLKRLGLGYNRDYPGTNHTGALQTSPADLRFVFPLPQAEIDGNPYIDDSDNNPIY